MYILNVTSRIKDYAFQINRLLQTEVKRWKIQIKKQKNAKCMPLKHQMESSQQRQSRLQDISARKIICSQLDTLEKRAIIYNFVLYSCDFHEGRQHFITLLCFLKKEFLNLTTNMQLLYFITTVIRQVHLARHHQRTGYSALPSV